jgi:spore maturation protein CgeB
VVAEPGPAFSVKDVYAGWVEALRELGQHVIEYNLSERLTFYSSTLKQVSEHTFVPYLTHDQALELAINGLYATLYKARPDVLLVVSGFFVPPELLDRARRSGTRTVVAYTEVPYENDRQLRLAPYADVNLVDDPTGIDEFTRHGFTWYVPHAYRPSVHSPGPSISELECDLAFVGTGFPSRIDFLEAMDLEGLDVLLAGNWAAVAESSPLRRFIATSVDDCLDNDKTVQVYRSARLGLNLYRREAQRPELTQGWAMGPREVEMAACGLFFLRDPRPEGDEVLDMLPTFTSPDEASDLLRYWLARPRERAELALKAREAVADRTFTNYAAQLLRLLER